MHVSQYEYFNMDEGDECMYCVKCGLQASDDIKFCTNCGTPIVKDEAIHHRSVKMQPTNDIESMHHDELQVVKNDNSEQEKLIDQGKLDNQNDQYDQQLEIGFSSHIQDPAFARYQKHSRIWSYSFSIGLAVIALIAFPIYGNWSGELDMPDSLYMGILIGGMFVVIAILQDLKRRFDSTWDGVVVHKDSYTIKKRNRNGTTTRTPYYVYKVQKENGKKVTHKSRTMPGLYSYYNVDDRVRHHKGFMYYEKFDKSKDDKILCAACLSMNDIKHDTCSRCKCPLLKVTQ